jgi:hypothetical protein
MKTSLNRIISLFIAILLVCGQPAGAVLADQDSAPTDQAVTVPTAESSPPPGDTDLPAAEPTPVSPPSPASPVSPDPVTGPTTPTGPQTPTGPDKPTGVIPDYAYNDATSHWEPTIQSSFHWDASIGRYTSPLYRYDNQPGWYHVIPGTVTGSSPTSAGVPTASGAALTSQSVTSPTSSNPAAALAALLGLSDPSNSNTGPSSNNSATNLDTSSALLQILGQALINNSDTSTAQSGDAGVSNNTKGGDAITGAASIIENFLNLLNSAWSWSRGDLSFFAQNLIGDHTGDITLNPTVTAQNGGGQLGVAPTGSLNSNTNTGPGSTNNAAASDNSNLTIVNKPTGAINNDINALAQSGNAAVTQNTGAGSATSGDAAVNINILNLINSAINSGDSFFGLLNIFGNLNGDILFPEGFLNGSSATNNAAGPVSSSASNSNTGPNSNNTASNTDNSTTSITNDPSASFSNNVNTAAQSGNVDVSNNTSAGDAMTGAAETVNNLFNLFNSNLFADNAVLVLVNVMGHWMGHIMTLPENTGSGGALLTGNGVVQNDNTGPNSSNSASNTNNTTTNITNSPSGSITNNINAGAISGDASVTGNTSAGNAQSGSAKVATNIANIFGSALNIKHWFGVLVINVFGDWNGSVGDNTSAGNAPITLSQLAPGLGAGTSNPSAAGAPSIAATSGGELSAVNGSGATSQAAISTLANNAKATLASVTQPTSAQRSAASNTGNLLLLSALTLMLAAAAFALERKYRA